MIVMKKSGADCGGWSTGGIPRLENRKTAHSVKHSGNRNKIKFFDDVWANHNKIRQELPLP
jgi:hypothetical protein